MFSKKTMPEESIPDSIIINNILKLYSFIKNYQGRPPLVLITRIDEIAAKLVIKIISKLVMVGFSRSNIFPIKNITNISHLTPEEEKAKDFVTMLIDHVTDVRTNGNTVAQKKVKTSRTLSLYNVLICGPQHAGKSSFINTFHKVCNPQSKIDLTWVGRYTEVGTVYYERVPIDNSPIIFFDTAGRAFENGFTSLDEQHLKKLMRGLPASINLLKQTEWINQAEYPKHKIDEVVIVLGAPQLVRQVETIANISPTKQMHFISKIPTNNAMLCELQEAQLNKTATTYIEEQLMTAKKIPVLIQTDFRAVLKPRAMNSPMSTALSTAKVTEVNFRANLKPILSNAQFMPNHEKVNFSTKEDKLKEQK